MIPVFEYQKTQSGFRAFFRGPPELLALLPKPDSTGFSLQEIQGAWLVKENDVQDFPTREKAALFYIETELIRPARKALVASQAALDRKELRWPRKLNRDHAGAIYDVLVKYLGAPKDLREEFLSTFAGKESQTPWEFESWNGHRVTFETQSRGPDLHGAASSASALSGFLLVKAYQEILSLFTEESEEILPTYQEMVRLPQRVVQPEPPSLQEEEEDYPDLMGLLPK